MKYHEALKKAALTLGGVTDDQLCHIFIDGLPGEMRNYVAMEQPGTTSKALEIARLFESMEIFKSSTPEVNAMSEIVARTNAFQQNSFKNQGQGNIIECLEDKINNMERLIREMKSDFQGDNGIRSNVDTGRNGKNNVPGGQRMLNIV